MNALSSGRLFSLKGRTAVVTGASGFLGQTMARALLANGARVVALGRSTALDGAVTAWKREFGRARVGLCRVDMEHTDALGQCLDALVKSERSIDILVNNAHPMGPRAGFNSADGTLENSSLDAWALNAAGGVYWPALAIQRLGPALKRRRRGSVINIASMYALIAPNPALYKGTRYLNPPGYSAAKAAMVALTRYVASFWGPEGVRCNALLPGPFPNTRTKTANAVLKDREFLKRLEERTALKRVGRPEDLAGALVYLASDASSFMTGQAVVVDGGWTIT